VLGVRGVAPVRRAKAVAAACAVLLAAGAGCTADPEAKERASAPAPVQADAEPLPATTAPTEPAPAPPVATVAEVPVPTPAPAAPASTQAGPGPAPPPTAAALGADLARIEVALRTPTTLAGQLPVLGLAQQVAYRQLAANPTWRSEVLDAVPASLHGAVIANADAEVRLASMHARRPTTFPKWRIVAPPPAADVLAAHQAAASEIGVPWQVLAAIHLVETRMGRIRGTSTAGARGPMQFLPATWAQYGAGGDIEDLTAASKAAARLLKRNGFNGNPRGAVWSYNHSDAYVDAVLAYAGVMTADAAAFRGYHGWQVFYRHAQGDTLLPEGWQG
jgi:hypothetical protein